MVKGAVSTKHYSLCPKLLFVLTFLDAHILICTWIILMSIYIAKVQYIFNLLHYIFCIPTWKICL
jgi:hypothetical protein